LLSENVFKCFQHARSTCAMVMVTRTSSHGCLTLSYNHDANDAKFIYFNYFILVTSCVVLYAADSHWVVHVSSLYLLLASATHDFTRHSSVVNSWKCTV